MNSFCVRVKGKNRYLRQFLSLSLTRQPIVFQPVQSFLTAVQKRSDRILQMALNHTRSLSAQPSTTADRRRLLA